MKLIKLALLISLVIPTLALAQRDISVQIGNANMSTWMRRITDRDEARRYRENQLRDMRLTFPLTVHTAETHAFPIMIFASVAIETAGGQRRWIDAQPEDTTRTAMAKTETVPRLKRMLFPNDAILAKMVNGRGTITVGFRGVTGKILQWRVSAVSQFPIQERWNQTQRDIMTSVIAADKTWRDPSLTADIPYDGKIEWRDLEERTRRHIGD